MTSITRGRSRASLAPAAGTLLTVTFRIAAQHYGLQVGEVLEIVRIPALVNLAGAPDYLCGLLNRRGDYLPVIDARRLIGAPSAIDLNSQIVLVGRAQALGAATPLFGLLVDQVLDVQIFQASQYTPLNRNVHAPFLCGVIDSGDGSILILGVNELADLIPDDVVET